MSSALSVKCEPDTRNTPSAENSDDEDAFVKARIRVEPRIFYVDTRKRDAFQDSRDPGE